MAGDARQARGAERGGGADRDRRAGGRRLGRLAGTAAAAALLAGALPGRAVVPADPPPFEVRPGGRMHMLHEKTLFKVDVLELEVFVDPGTAETLAAMTGREYSRELADAVSGAVLAAPQAFVRMSFLRDLKQDQFFDGIEDNLKRTLKAGWIDADYLRDTLEKLPQWYDFMAEDDRGIRKGDRMVYWVHGDTLDATYFGVEAEVLLDRHQVHPMRRYGVLGSYFAPGSDFREKLVRSLLEGEG